MNGSTRSAEICLQLVKEGYHVEVLSATKPNQNEKPNDYEGIKIKWINCPSGNNLNFRKRIYSFLKFMLVATYYSCKKKYSLIYCTSTPLTVGFPALIARIFRKTRFIFEVRDVWPEIPIAMGIIKNKFLIKSLKFFSFQLYKYSDKVITLSADMKNEIMNYNIDEKKILVAENGSRRIYFNRNVLSKKEFLISHNLNLDMKLIIYPGSFGYVNDLSYIVELAALFNNEICFLLVGDGIDKKRCVSLAKSNNTLNRNLIISDPIPKNEVFDLISISDFLISTVADIPKLDQNSANKFFDGLRSGKCVLINHGGWQKKFLLDTKAGISLSRNLTKAKSQILEIISNENTLNNYKKNALQNSTKFEMKLIVNKVIKEIEYITK